MKTLRELAPNSFIFEKPGALTKAECQTMIDCFEAHPEDQAVGSVSGQRYAPECKQSTDVMIRDQAHWKEADGILFNSISEALKEMTEQYEFLYGTHIVNDRGYQIQRTNPGEFYTWHFDSDHPDKTRVLVVIWYLNTLDSSQGGTTDFKEQGIQVRPEQGKMLLFPPYWTHYHRGAPLLSGKKYIATTWITATR